MEDFINKTKHKMYKNKYELLKDNIFIICKLSHFDPETTKLIGEDEICNGFGKIIYKKFL